ncbi:hypothetical protein QQ045_006800 [Rhodiola kirilowii]
MTPSALLAPPVSPPRVSPPCPCPPLSSELTTEGNEQRLYKGHSEVTIVLEETSCSWMTDEAIVSRPVIKVKRGKAAVTMAQVREALLISIDTYTSGCRSLVEGKMSFPGG